MKMAEFMTSDSPYLCKEMLWDTPVVVTIDHVEGNHDVPIPDSSWSATSNSYRPRTKLVA